MAVSLPLVRESVRGLRLEWEIVLLLLFLEIAFVDTVRSRGMRVGLAGVVAGLLSLLRTNYLFGLTPILALALFPRHRGGIVGVVMAWLIMWGLCAPRLWNGYRFNGRAFDNIQAEWWANVEFAGQPGWRSKREVWRNVQDDSAHLTPFEYFFGLHTIPELVVGSVRGTWKLVRHLEVVAFHQAAQRATGFTLGFVDVAFQLASIVGLILATGRARFRWLPIAFCILIAHLPFLYDRGLVEPWRHTYQVFPLMVFGTLLTIQTFWQQIGHKLAVGATASYQRAG